MKKWTTMCVPVSIGLSHQSWGNYLVTPDGQQILIDFQRVKMGDVESETLPDGRFHEWLVNPTNPKPVPSALAESIAMACNLLAASRTLRDVKRDDDRAVAKRIQEHNPESCKGWETVPPIREWAREKVKQREGK